MNKDEFIEFLKNNAKDEELNALVEKGVALVASSIAFEAFGSLKLTMFNVWHFLNTYSIRLDEQRRSGRVVEGVEETVDAFTRAYHKANGLLGLIGAKIDGRIVAVWFDDTRQIVGCVLERMLPL